MLPNEKDTYKWLGNQEFSSKNQSLPFSNNNRYVKKLESKLLEFFDMI